MLELAENEKLNVRSLSLGQLLVPTSNPLHTPPLSTPRVRERNLTCVQWELVFVKEVPFAILLNSACPAGNERDRHTISNLN
jgi:hypothetical protein